MTRAAHLVAGDQVVREYARQANFPKVDWTKIIEHIDHAVKIAGIDHVGLGSDFDGAMMPFGMEDASHLPQITEALLEKAIPIPTSAKSSAKTPSASSTKSSKPPNPPHPTCSKRPCSAGRVREPCGFSPASLTRRPGLQPRRPLPLSILSSRPEHRRLFPVRSGGIAPQSLRPTSLFRISNFVLRVSFLCALRVLCGEFAFLSFSVTSAAPLLPLW